MKPINIVSLTITLLFTSLSSEAQDLVVTEQGDSLNCKITKLKSNTVYFSFKYEDEIRSTLLPLDKVKDYKYNYFQVTEVQPEEIKITPNYPTVRFNFNGGWSYRLAKPPKNLPPMLEQYLENLRSGFHFRADVSYFLSEQLGVGFKYGVFRAKNSIEKFTMTFPDGQVATGEMSDNISVSFIGPILTSRFMGQEKRNAFLLNMGIGYLGYKNEAVFFDDLLIKGNTLGFCWDIGYDFYLNREISFGLQASFINGILNQYEMIEFGQSKTIELPEDERESLYRIDISAGIRINL